MSRGISVDSRPGKSVDQAYVQSRLSYEDARTKIQASDRELDLALKDRHILNINGLPNTVRPAVRLLTSCQGNFGQLHHHISASSLSLF